MPISTAPVTTTIDKLRIEEFTVNPHESIVTIRFSKGYEDNEGTFIQKEVEVIKLKNVIFNESLYTDVKNALYELLLSNLTQ